MKMFCNVGKAVLTRALGLQQNYNEIIESEYDVIDTQASGCEGCKWHSIKEVTRSGEELHDHCMQVCASCPHKCMKKEYTYKRVYHNEKNRYGYQPRLKRNAIKLFIAYHFLDVNSLGFAKNVDLRILAEKLNCDIKTINNNNETLREYGYILYSKTDTNLINLYLPEYENYFKTAKEGGRGFLTMSDTVFEELLKIDSINELRITLRQLMEFDLLSNRRANSMEKSYKELRRVLPNYCKRNVIQKVSNHLSMFVTEIMENMIRFIIKPEYDSKLQKEEQTAYYEKELLTFSQEFSNEVSEINTNIYDRNESKFANFFDDASETAEYKCWFFDPLELTDLASLCSHFSLHKVMKALQVIYKTYVLPGTKITNLGGLTRTIILANAQA